MNNFFVRKDGSFDEAASKLFDVSNALRNLFPRERSEVPLSVEVPSSLGAAIQNAVIQWETSAEGSSGQLLPDALKTGVDGLALALKQALGRIKRHRSSENGSVVDDRSPGTIDGGAVVFQVQDMRGLDDAIFSIYRLRAEKLESTKVEVDKHIATWENSLISRGCGPAFKRFRP